MLHEKFFFGLGLGWFDFYVLVVFGEHTNDGVDGADSG
jgi:hypothetical protein